MSKKFNVNDIVEERKNELDSSALFQTKSPPAPAQEVANPMLPDTAQEDDHARISSPLPSGQVPQSATPSAKRAFVRRTFDFSNSRNSLKPCILGAGPVVFS